MSNLPTTILSEDETIGVTNLTLDQLFIAMQPDEKSKAEAREWIKNENTPNENK